MKNRSGEPLIRSMKEYREAVPRTIQKYGGRYLERAEGHWQPKRVVVPEFPSVEQAKRWYDFKDYRDRKAPRQAASSSNTILVEGTEA